MHVKILKFFVFITLLNLIACTPEQDIFSPVTTDDTIENTTDLSDFNAAILNEINKYRQSGCKCGNTNMPPVPALKWDNLLEEAALLHTQDMVDNNFFAHEGSDGSSSSERVTATGYNWRTVGENIAYGYHSIEAVVKAWIDSEGHCQNIMNESFTEMGAAEYDTFWTQTLAKPQ
jgi:uncharacterized protein YkwD